VLFVFNTDALLETDRRFLPSSAELSDLQTRLRLQHNPIMYAIADLPLLGRKACTPGDPETTPARTKKSSQSCLYLPKLVLCCSMKYLRTLIIWETLGRRRQRSTIC